MITLEQYVGPHAGSQDWNQERIDNAVELLSRVNPLLDYLEREYGVVMRINPATKSQISGQTLGGFRPQDAKQGAPNSSHKEGQGVDVTDPVNTIDLAITDAILTKFNLYREHPDKTKTWVHLTTRPPGSKRRTFMP